MIKPQRWLGHNTTIDNVYKLSEESGDDEHGKTVITVKELAPLLDTTPGVIYRMVKKGEMPYRKIGRKTVFSLERIKKWLEGEDENNVNLRQHVKGN